MTLLAGNPALEAEILINESSYANNALEIARDFVEYLEDTYVSFTKFEDNLSAQLATINLSSQFQITIFLLLCAAYK